MSAFLQEFGRTARALNGAELRGVVGGLVWLELIRNLAVRDVEIRYKHSLLGLYWAIINPLLTAAIFTFVFGVVFHASSKSVPYVIFLLTGLTFWNLFANSVLSATTSITGNAALLAKVYFPRLVLPTAAVMARLIDLAFSLVVLAIFLLIYRVPIHWTVIFLPLLLLLELGFTLGIGYTVAALNVLYRDMSQLMGLVLMVWMYLSPVMYSATMLHPALRILLFLNPMGAILQAERDVLFQGALSEPLALLLALFWTVLAFLVGLVVFRRLEPLFAEVM